MSRGTRKPEGEHVEWSEPTNGTYDPSEIAELKLLVLRCYKALHRGGWQDGESDAELSEAINDKMSELFGVNWTGEEG